MGKILTNNGRKAGFELDILQPEGVEVQIYYNGQTYDAELVPLTIHEWNAAMNEIPFPPIPKKVEGGKLVNDEEDEEYKRARDEVIVLRMIITVVRSLQKGGNLQNLAGLPAREQARIFGESVDYGLFNDFYAALNSHRQRHEARLNARAANFQPLPDDHSSDRAAPESELVGSE